MANIKDNTVSAANQMVNSSELSFLGNENAKMRILIVGNSITRHGPLAEIGWNSDWGMAASAPEMDYVHRLYTMLQDAGHDVYMRIRQCAHWEGHFLDEDILDYYVEEHTFDADIVVFRLGENVKDEDKPYFQEAMKKFIKQICPRGKVVYTTCFWKNAIIDDAIKAVALERNEVCIDGCFSKEEKNMALGQFEHAGVAMHPSDEGMKTIAKTIFDVIKSI